MCSCRDARRHIRLTSFWEFTTDSGASHRVIFECKNRGRNLEQNAVLAFRGVVEEVGFQSLPTTGVMVHLTGYQSGARKVAETYGVVILELRDPLDKDVADRVMGIRVSFTGIVPMLSDLQIDETEVLSSTALSGPVLNYVLRVEDSAGRRMSVVKMLTDGESMTPAGEAVPEHRVTRSFDPPATLLVSEEPAARVNAISATVWGERGDPFDFTIGGRERIAWMVKDTLGGARAWFTIDGKLYINDN